MSIFKCKMCGGTIEFEQGATVGVCDSCGTRQTLPRLDDDRKANLYDRANHFRRNNDFDKAMGIYEQILNEDNTDAEAYWSLVLCRYGIEYVEDPATHRRVPTVNRAQFTSIYMDEDYKSALQYADYNQKMIYEQEAKAIDDIQKGILEISSKEEPFDDRENFAKVIRFGDEQTENELRGYIAHINERNENDRLSALYQSAVKEMKAAKTEDEFNAIASKFDEIAEFGDSESLAEQCREKAKDKIYDEAILLMKDDIIDHAKSALDKFEKNPDWKDSAEQIEKCKTKIEEIERQEEERIVDEKRKKKIIKITKIVSPIVAVAVVFFILLNTVIIPSVKYKTAISDVDNGKYDKAIEGFSELGDYKDSADQIKETKLKEANVLISAGDYISAYNLLSGLNYKDSESILNSIKSQYKEALYKEALFNKAEVGSYVLFGSYEQDNDTDNGKEDIEWLVLEKKDDRLLVISKYALDCKQYNESFGSVTWETCTLRKWLNGDFINEAFSSEEKSLISEVTVSADANPEYGTNPGNDTKDKVFLLSIDEVNKYFNTDETRMCAPTAYAKAQGAWTCSDYELTSGEATCWWWLRSPGGNQTNAAYVDLDGSVYCIGNYVNYDVYGSVRPALWISLE